MLRTRASSRSTGSGGARIKRQIKKNKRDLKGYPFSHTVYAKNPLTGKGAGALFCRNPAAKRGKSECGALIMESLSQDSRKSQGNARDFWEEEKQCHRACGLVFTKPLQDRRCFDERRREKNECRAAFRRGEHSVVSQITANRSAFARDLREQNIVNVPLYGRGSNKAKGVFSKYAKQKVQFCGSHGCSFAGAFLRAHRVCRLR